MMQEIDIDSLRLLYHDALAVYPCDQHLEGLEGEGAVPDKLGWQVDAVPPARHIDLDFGLGCQRVPLTYVRDIILGCLRRYVCRYIPTYVCTVVCMAA